MRTPTPTAADLAEALGTILADPKTRALVLIMQPSPSNPRQPRNARYIEETAVVETTGESLAEVIDLASRRGAR